MDPLAAAAVAVAGERGPIEVMNDDGVLHLGWVRPEAASFIGRRWLILLLIM